MQNYHYQYTLAPTLYGQVDLYRHDKNKDLMAVKSFNLKSAKAQTTLQGHLVCKENAFREIHLHQQLHHPNILKMKKSWKTSTHLFMGLEYCARGELLTLLQDPTSTSSSLSDLQKYFQDIVHGVEYLHHQGYGHRDLSLENILISDQNVCKICDFGVIAPAFQFQQDSVGKIFYMAPEVVEGEFYLPAQADVWSLGIILFMLLFKIPPIEIANSSDYRFQMLKENGVRGLLKAWNYDHMIPESVIDLLNGLLQVNPRNRWTIDNIARHPWVAPKKQNFRGSVRNLVKKCKNWLHGPRRPQKIVSSVVHEEATLEVEG